MTRDEAKKRNYKIFETKEDAFKNAEKEIESWPNLRFLGLTTLEGGGYLQEWNVWD